jgi:choloylglycine hydrolase
MISLNQVKMKHLTLTIIITLALTSALGCTTFTINDGKGKIVFGRNFDFPVGMGHIEVNKRGIYKTAFVRPPEEPLSWVSIYGSITFNQIGREFPYGGMNEAGLVIEQMWLQEASYPLADHRFGLTELQWIQYQLDNAATVQEVLDSDSLVRISYTSTAPLHFLVSDATGDVASIEYIGGKILVHRDKNLPYQVLANCSYEHSLAYKSSIDAGKDTTYNEWTVNSSGRFTKAANMIENMQGQDPVEYAFVILDSVAQENNTQWSIVYDISNLVIRYKSALNNNVQDIQLADFDFSCNDSRPYASIEWYIEKAGGFRELSKEANLGLIRSVVANVDFLKDNVPDEANVAMTAYVFSLECTE